MTTPTSTPLPLFSCRRCQALLEIDSSFVELREDDFLKAHGDDPSDSFVVLPRYEDGGSGSEAERKDDENGGPKPDGEEGEALEIIATQPSGSRVAIAMAMIADRELDIDYPMCEECAGAALQLMQEQLQATEEELASYEEHLTEMRETTTEPTPEAEFEREMVQSRAEEAKLREELSRIEEASEALQRDMRVLEMERHEVEAIETQYWQDFNDFESLLSDCEEQRDAVCSRIDRLNAQLDRLRRTNVYNDVFHIWHDGHFGTICNLRLGRLPSVRVPWDEINAAWGQAVLLLFTLARKSQFTFSAYSFSKMARISDNNTYELYTSGPVLGFWSRRFDQAMTWFLQCVQEFGEWVARQDPSFKLPYWIKNDTINGLSIKVQINKEEEWTKALKYMLTNLKWLLSWVARRENATATADIVRAGRQRSGSAGRDVGSGEPSEEVVSGTV